MKHVIIGTAGHVDHGKTMLIKTLTGIDTDRLIEEKKRGITIDLGFAHLDFDDGTQAGIVDVPGHEKFIKNMLAGAGGIDIAMLIVAADEGFMPQTVEHLGILSLLGIHDGLVVITKTDLAEPDWIQIILEDTEERVRGTFLEGKPILAVSAYTGQGIDQLKTLLHGLVQQAGERSLRVPFRLPIDRVFSVEGFGTVVTGTLIEGCINQDEIAQLVPSGLTAKVRNLQVHGANVPAAFAGQRVAVNLSGLKKGDIQRGDTVAKPGTVPVCRMLDVRLQNLDTSQRVIQNGSCVHLYHGSSVVLSKIMLLDKDELLPGESCYAQLRLMEPLAARSGDHFVIRFYSPLETIGGGVILDDTPLRHRRGDKQVILSLDIKSSGSDDQKLVQAVAEERLSLPDSGSLAAKLSMEPDVFAREMQQLISRGMVLELLPERYVAASVLDGVCADCQRLLDAYHKTNPLHAGMKQAELRQKLLPKTELTAAGAILAELLREGIISLAADRYSLPTFQVILTKRQQAIREELLQIYIGAGLDVPAVEELWPMFPAKDKANCQQVLENLISTGELMLLSPQLALHQQVYRQVYSAARDWFSSHDTLTLAEFRDLLGTSRKYALAVLEYFDRNKMTKKDGDFRRAVSLP